MIISNEKKVIFKISDREYCISSRFPMNLSEQYITCFAKTKDAKKAISLVVHEKINNIYQQGPSLSEIEALDDIVFKPFIEAIVENDEELYKCFNDNVEIESIIERFSVSFITYWESMSNRLLESVLVTLSPYEKLYELANPPWLKQLNEAVDLPWLKQVQDKINQPQFQMLQEMAKSLQSEHDKALPSLEHFELIKNTFNDSELAQMQKITKLTQSEWFPVAQQLAEAASSAVFPFQRIFSQYSTLFNQITAEITIPTLTKERKKKLITSHKKWGEYGWTILLDAPIKFFNTCPDSIKEADKLALAYCKKENMQALFTRLKEKRIKATDLDEAIYCYNSRKYKACVLILFSIMDAKMIRKQPKAIESEQRSTGARAVKKIKDKIDSTSDIDSKIFTFLNYKSTISCLFTIFEDTKDFKKKLPVINRHYIAHGMCIQPVKKKDCIKLFHALYHLTDLIDLF
ncbi:MAG: hypothetical protein FWD38_04325 [Oscillospiraceae bacterium]|nr:hypothetical protein [Oscillospiraceae bacterium]